MCYESHRHSRCQLILENCHQLRHKSNNQVQLQHTETSLSDHSDDERVFTWRFAPVRTGPQIWHVTEHSHRAGWHRLASVGRLDCWSAAPGLAPGLAPAVWLTPGGTGIGTGCIGRSRLAPGLAPAGIASAGIGCIGRSHAHTRAPACTAARPPAQPQPQVSLDKEREDSKPRQATQIVVQGSLFWRSKSHRRFGRVRR